MQNIFAADSVDSHAIRKKSGFKFNKLTAAAATPFSYGREREDRLALRPLSTSQDISSTRGSSQLGDQNGPIVAKCTVTCLLRVTY
ncbi:hypothetical protein KC347_g316 [Hortaea werneckii]|nr:hypothetical protein KC347_g316 [Hortaea werneckii]